MHIEFVKAGAGHSRSGIGAVGKIFGALSLFGFSAAAMAHPGHGTGFISAFAHPFSGVDHLLMMLFVGVWAGRSGAALRWRLPALFLAGMFAGWIAGAAGVVLPGLESGIAATLIALGVLLVSRIQPQAAVQMALVVLFALLHGLAHGGELAGGLFGNELSGSAWLSAAGMLSATAALHALGFASSLLLPRESALYRLGGMLLAAIGGGLLAAA